MNELDNLDKEELIKLIKEYEKKEAQTWERKKYLGNRFFNLIAGKKIEVSLNAVLSKISNQKTPNSREISELVGAIIRRLTRVGLITILIGLLPTLLLFQQNRIISKQNNLLEAQNGKLDNQNTLIQIQNKNTTQQSQLIESGRRANLIFELSSILNSIGEETLKDKNLSDNLIGRIIALSKSLKPYRYLDDSGKLTEKILSPERAQLLISIANSKLSKETLDRIFKDADFSYSDLTNANLAYTYLKGANLKNSYVMNTDFSYSDIQETDFRGAYFNHVKFVAINYTRIEDDTAMIRTYIRQIGENSFMFEYLNDFTKKIEGRKIFTTNDFVNLAGADIRNIKLEGAEIPNKDWLESLGEITPPPNGVSEVILEYQINKVVEGEIEYKSKEIILIKKPAANNG